MKLMSKDLMGATSVMIVLSILKKEDSYGFGMVQHMKEATDGKILLREASIYPVMKKLEKKGMVKSYWKLEGDERPRRYFKILPAGEDELEKRWQDWITFHEALEGLMNSDT